MKLPESGSKYGLIFKRIRAYLAKAFLTYCGKEVNIEKGAVIPALLEIGDYSGVGINANILGKVTIGKYVMMGPDCIIYTVNHSFSKTDMPMIKQGFEKMKPVKICNDVWIGGRVIILPGVTIGQGAIVGAGAVVSKNVPEFAVVGGNPARIIRNRKDEKKSSDPVSS